VLGAKIRHELEHARQWDAFGKQAFDLNDLILQVMARKVGGLRGGGRLYNLNPLEVDANAAAAKFAWARYGEEVARGFIDEEHEDAVLFRSLTGPAPQETLPIRCACFLFQFVDLCEMEAAARDRPFADLIDEAWPGMAGTWQRLQEL
jgi:hypothetical protein